MSAAGRARWFVMARILIANDNGDLLDTCRDVLEAAGHEVRTIMNGGEAFSIALDWQPHLIIVDWVMPDMDGTAVISQLRTAGATRSLLILMISGSENARVRAGRAGADAFLPKPFGADDLLRAVAALIDTGRSTGPAPV